MQGHEDILLCFILKVSLLCLSHLVDNLNGIDFYVQYEVRVEFYFFFMDDQLFWDHWFISESFPTALQWHFCQNLCLCIFQDLFLGSLVYSTTKNLYNTDLMYSFIISLNTWKGKPSHHAFLQGRVLIIVGPLYFHINFNTWLSKTYLERESHWIYAISLGRCDSFMVTEFSDSLIWHISPFI